MPQGQEITNTALAILSPDCYLVILYHRNHIVIIKIAINIILSYTGFITSVTQNRTNFMSEPVLLEVM